MASEPQQVKGRDHTLSTLDVLIQALNLARDTCGIPSAQAVFGSVSALLSTIKGSLADRKDYVELGKYCASVCRALDQGLDGRHPDELSHSVLGAIGELMTTVAEIQGNAAALGERNAISRLFHSRNDKYAIAAWRKELKSILQIFNTELLLNNHMVLLDVRRNALAGQGSVGSCRQSASVPLGELPPQPPRACFGRDLVIEEIVSLAKNFKPVALIGAGGIGKTSIALTVLHDDRIKNVFGDNRRFIRCDKFPASRAHFLARLSKVIGAGVENPEDLTPLQSALSSRGMILFLDNAESILDPQGEEAREIYAIVEELSRFRNICLGITSRLSTVPPCCKRVVIPTLSTEAACDIFYNTYDRAERSGIIEDLVQRLDFHALSITLLATTASHNVWDHIRLAKEWETHRARALRTDYNESLAATIELSLASPTFRKLGPEARELLGVAAFFPQGIDENNLDWLFPAISDRRGTFDKFFALSLTSRTDGFITMLGPIRDYLCPLDPKSSQLLCATKDRYFSRLSVSIDPDDPGFEESRWILSEDVNVEHLLHAFSSIDANSDDVWNTCGDFMEHLYWHKPRQTVLRTKIEDLPDDHRSKPRCLFQLSRLFESTGNNTERKRVLTRALKLERERGDNIWIAYTLEHLAETNRLLGLNEEGILQAKEALEISERLGAKRDQADCLDTLARLFYYDHQLDAAEETATRTIDFLSGDGEEFRVCKSHRLLGKIYDAKGEKEKAIHHFETALEIASTPNWQDQLFWIRYSLAKLFRDEDRFDEAHVHTDRAKSHATDDPYNLGCATGLHASIWYRQGRLEEAKSEALRAIEIFEKLGTSKDSMGGCKDLLGKIERATEDGLPLSS